MKPMKHIIEDTILRHSRRGMHLLREYMNRNFCGEAVQKLLSLKRGNILLTTGFYVAGFAETDGPVGTLFLARALKKLGFAPVIVTDSFCRGFFEEPGIEVKYMEFEAGEEAYRRLLEYYRPDALISIERCGINQNRDYANMRGMSIAAHTARTDLMFELANKQGILTIGVGDGGNEIGMGNLAEIIDKKLNLVPCVVTVDYLIIATVSNWGAYGMMAYLELLTGEKLLPDFSEAAAYLERIVRMGSVDGVTKEQEASVDGFSLEVEKEILTALRDDILCCLNSVPA